MRLNYVSWRVILLYFSAKSNIVARYAGKTDFLSCTKMVHLFVIAHRLMAIQD